MARFLPLTMLYRKKKQLAFIACVLLALATMSSLQYVVYLIVSWRLSPPQSHGKSGQSTPAAVKTPVEAEVPVDVVGQVGRRTLGIAMPTIDYARFKKLEARQAPVDDMEVLHVARQAMMEPFARRRLKIRTPRKTHQAALVDNVLGNRTNGFFVECGAFDGETASNTVYLENTRKWTGLLIEMDAAFYTQLVGKQRNAWSINACLSARNSVVEMKYFESNGQLGRLADDNTTRALPPHSALCFPLESLLLALDKKHVDYFSLDVEGFELDILRTIPFDRLDIDVVSAEYLHAREPQAAYAQLMTQYGYQLFASVNKMDFIFVKKRLMAAHAQRVRHQKRLEAAVVVKRVEKKEEEPLEGAEEKRNLNDNNFIMYH